ncbi:MAG: carboxypeptidase regulatory-like domain-containing protein [Planctomycetes bacterium]|nr:carboxypeptidase regulatory-like domain-containing protein [Planctomycetota bacterium]
MGSVHGTISLDGEPLPGVTIYFKPDVGRQSIAKSDAEGVYEAMYLIDEEGVKVGPCSVTVEWAIDDSGPSIPLKYGSDGELKLDVQPGDNPFKIEMESK